jgi:YHS domain-containing protein
MFFLGACSIANGKEAIFSKGGFAIGGYDSVAYFLENKPVKGNDNFRFEWKGATWLFVNQKNRDTFVAEPEKYAPQYGGYCAYGVWKGSAAKTEPDAWTIVDGKLYLNYSKRVQKNWEKKTNEYILKGDENWLTLQKKFKK